MTLPTLHIGIASSNKERIRILQKLLLNHTSHFVDWENADPVNLLETSPIRPPNLILIDISCEHIDGVAMTLEILNKFDTEVLLFSNSISDDASKVFEAMGHGALDVITLPDDHTCNSNEVSVLIKKITNVCKLVQPKPKNQQAVVKKNAIPKIDSSDLLIVIGSSTGGPTALVKVLEKLPHELNAAIIIVQHVDFQFAETLAHWLNEQVTLPVRIAINGDYPEAGTVLVAATNDHLYMRRDMSLSYKIEPADYSYRPSVDVFFTSAVENWKGGMLGVLLTGMGRDGAIGLRAIRDRGCPTIAQNEASSVVFGMPKAAIDIGAACKVLNINAIADEIVTHLHTPKTIDKRTG